MATRASVKFTNKKGQTIVNVYKHWDGNPEELGKTIQKITSPANPASDFGCMIAQFISAIKVCVGDTCINLPGEWGNCGEQYLYDVREQLDGTVMVFVNKTTFTLDEVLEMGLVSPLS
jgi:hypothetical protein